MPRSIINLPAGADDGDDLEVYVNGVRQHANVDYYVDRGAIIFDRALRRDRVSRWRWLLGAWGVGTYRQDDTVDIRYSAGGETRSRHALPIRVVEQDDGLDA